MAQVTKWKLLDPESVRNFLEVNPGFIEKHRNEIGNDKPEIIRLMGDLRTAEIKCMCFKGGDLAKAPVLAHNSPDLVAFCEAVRNRLVTIDCSEHIRKSGNPVLCGLINEECYRNEPELLILAQGINISNRLLFTRKDMYVFVVTKNACEKKPSLQKEFGI